MVSELYDLPTEGVSLTKSNCMLEKYFQIAKKNTKLYLIILEGSTSQQFNIQLDSISFTEFPPIVKKYHYLRCLLEGGVILSARDDSQETKVYPDWKKSCNMWKNTSNPHYHFYINQRMCLIVAPSGNYLLSRDHFLLVSDLCSQRFILTLSCFMAENLRLEQYPRISGLEYMLE